MEWKCLQIWVSESSWLYITTLILSQLTRIASPSRRVVSPSSSRCFLIYSPCPRLRLKRGHSCLREVWTACGHKLGSLSNGGLAASHPTQEFLSRLRANGKRGRKLDPPFEPVLNISRLYCFKTKAFNQQNYWGLLLWRMYRKMGLLYWISRAIQYKKLSLISSNKN